MTDPWRLTTEGVAPEAVRPLLDDARLAGLGVGEALVRLATRSTLPPCVLHLSGDGQRAALGWQRHTELVDHLVPAEPVAP